LIVARAILVTGANGFVGRHLVDLLLEEDAAARLHAWTRPRGPGQTSATDRPHADDTRVTWREVDAQDRTAVRDGLAAVRPDEIYHLAGAANVAHSWDATAETLDANVGGTHILLDALRSLGVDPRVLVPGSATIYAASDTRLAEDSPLGPASPYALSKLAQEMLGLRAAQDDGQQVLLVRAFNHIGPGQDASFFAPAFARQLVLIEQGLAPPVLHVGNLEPRRDLTDVRDTVRAYRALMKHGTPARPYNVCSGKAVRIRDVLDALLARCRARVTVEIDPARLRPNDMPLMLGSADRLRAETGWTPRIPLEQTVADLLEDARARVQRE
jgi:GDP-4-dehydro-6-deoxy-D-mannose reductase